MVQAQLPQPKEAHVCRAEMEGKYSEHRRRAQGQGSSELCAGVGQQNHGVLLIPLDVQGPSVGHAQARLLTPVHFHLFRYLDQSHLLV